MNKDLDDGIVDLMMVPCGVSVLNLNKVELRRLGYKIIYKTNAYVQSQLLALGSPYVTNPMLAHLRVGSIKDHLMYYAQILESNSSGHTIIGNEQMIKIWQESLDEIQGERSQGSVHLKYLFLGKSGK
jgi:hypothetical protein